MNWKFKFVGSFISIKKLPKPLPDGEIPIFGRSNVGKSSFINAMANTKGLAKTSSKPGKTRTLNYYNINSIFYFVDLPGYGYAKISASERERWGQMVLTYLGKRQQIKFYIILIDIRHKLHDTDIKSLELAKYFGKESLVILTKKDKLTLNQAEKQYIYFREVLQSYPVFDIVEFSSVTKEGRDNIMKIIERKLGIKDV